MPDVLACDLPIRPIKPSDTPPEKRPSPASFSRELVKLLAGLVVR